MTPFQRKVHEANKAVEKEDKFKKIRQQRISRAAFMEHLKVCESCRLKYELYQAAKEHGRNSKVAELETSSLLSKVMSPSIH